MHPMIKFIAKYNTMPPAVKAGIWFTICNVLQRGIQFLATPIYTRVLSPEEYGMYSIFTSWLSIMTVLASLNLSGGVFYNGLIKYEDDKYRFTSSVQVLGSIATIIVFLIYSLLYPYLEGFIGLSYTLSILMFLVILINPAFQFWSVQERIQYRYRSLIVFSICNALLIPVIGIASVVYFDLGYIGVIWGYVIGNCLISAYFYVKNLLIGKSVYVKEYWNFSLRFSLPLIPHYLAQILLGQIGKIMVNYYLGIALAGVYTLAYQIALIMNLLITGINNALVPWMYRTLKNESYSEIRIGTLKLVLIVVLCTSVLMILAPEFILFFGTEKYMQAKWIIPPIMFSTCVTFVYCIYGTVLFFFEETKKVAWATTSGALVNIIINFFMIPKYGLVAAAYAMAIGYVVMYFFYYYYTYVVCSSRGYSVASIFDVKSFLIILISLFIISLIVTYSFTVDNYIRYFALMITISLTVFRFNTIKNFLINK